jgi:hypothetical protein
MKIGIIAQQGGFSKKVEELRNFEDCYVRAQYEMLEMGRDPHKAKFALELILAIPKSMDAKKKLAEFEELAKSLRDLPPSLTPAPVKAMAQKLDAALKMEDEAKRDEALKAVEPTLKDLEAPLKALDEEKMRETRTATIMAALERGLGLPDAKGKASPEIDNARAMLTYYYLNAAPLEDGGFNVDRLRDAIRVGEEFARTNPRAGQAASAASYCMQAYSQLIASYGDSADEGAVKQDVSKMREFADYIKLRWPSEFVADMARHQLALLYLREKKVPEAIKELEKITPDYPTYAGTQFLLANTALAAERDGVPPIPGDQAGAYRQRALKALETIPVPLAGAEPANNQAYVHAKSLLAQELFKEKKYPQMQQITDTLLARLPTLRMSDTDEENQQLREDFTNSLKVIALFGLYGEANVAFQAKDYAKTAGMLDTLIDQINDDKYPQIKTNQQLGQALVVMAMQSNLQIGKLDRARLAAQALQVAVADGVGGGDLPLGLRIVMGVIDGRIKEVEAKKDPAELARTVKGFDGILQDLVAKEKKPTVKFHYAVAQAYMLMKDFKKAADFAQKIEEPKPPAKPAEVTSADEKNLVADPVVYKESVEKELATLRKNNAPQSQIDAVTEYITKLEPFWSDHKLYQAGQLLRIRMLRLNKELAKAREGINKALGDKENPGWGAKNIETQVEHLRLYVDEEDFYHGFLVGQKLVEALVKHADRSSRIKDFYLEGYYLMSYCYLRQAQKQTVASKRTSAMKTTAQLILELERKYSDFGGGEWQTQMIKMIDGEPELKAEYQALKAM